MWNIGGTTAQHTNSTISLNTCILIHVSNPCLIAMYVELCVGMLNQMCVDMVMSEMSGSVSGDQGLIIFEYIVVRSVMNGSVSGDRVSDMFSLV